jgi:hypothetical protein
MYISMARPHIPEKAYALEQMAEMTAHISA